jgi:hypothetical protein
MARKQRFRNTGAGKGVKERLTPGELHRFYVEERLSQAEIARRYGCTPQFVSLLVKEYGITRDPSSRQPKS